MIKASLKYVGVLFLMLFSLVGCEKVVDIDLDNLKPRMVLNGFLGADTIPEVCLSSSLAATESEDKIVMISDAQVNLVVDGEAKIPMTCVGEGVYRPNNLFKLKQGQEVTVQVEHKDYPSVSSFQKIPEKVAIESVSYEVLDGGEVRFHLSFTDPEAVKNYYRIVLVEMTTVYDWTTDDYISREVALDFTSKDPVFEKREDEVSSYENPSNTFSDALFNGENYQITLETKYLIRSNEFEGLILKIQLQSISEDYFLFTRSLPLHLDTKDSPFTEPVRVHSNVQNGYGILCGFSADSKTVSVERKE